MIRFFDPPQDMRVPCSKTRRVHVSLKTMQSPACPCMFTQTIMYTQVMPATPRRTLHVPARPRVAVSPCVYPAGSCKHWCGLYV